MTIETDTPQDTVYTRTLPRMAESAQSARLMASSALDRWGLTDLDDVARLVVTELVANAVHHARRQTFRVTVTRQGLLVVRIAVTDLSRELPQACKAGCEDETGRGLAIIEAVTGGRWGAERLLWGKRVWAELTAGRITAT